MKIELANEANEELWEAFQRLVPQLTTNHPPPSRNDLQELIGSNCSCLVIARASDADPTILGAACVTTYRVPTGVRAVIEDVIVDNGARGHGIGEALIQRCLEIAREEGADAVALTSNPRRLSANRLYTRLGFTLRETNAYLYKFA